MLFVAAKFSQEEMPKTFDAGAIPDIKPQEFVVVPRGQGEDVAFVATLEHKASEQIKRRREAYPRVVRRATQQEIDAWWERKALERRAMVMCKEKARELNLDIKISHVRVDMHEARAEFHFTSVTRVDFRALVRDLSLLLRMRIDLWQIGARDEARMVDGFGVCGLQTCCSTWLKEFQPITIRMAKDQDINLPPNKLSGQCGRLLCCLAYEVDQYREMAREALPKGATIRFADGREAVIVDRNLVGGSYSVIDGTGAFRVVKPVELEGAEAMIPAQLKQMGKKFGKPSHAPPAAEGTDAPPEKREFKPIKPSRFAEPRTVAVPEPEQPMFAPAPQDEDDATPAIKPQREQPPAAAPQPAVSEREVSAPDEPTATDAEAAPATQLGERPQHDRRQGRRKPQRTNPKGPQAQGGGEKHRDKPKAPEGGGPAPSAEGNPGGGGEKKSGGRPKKRRRGR